MTVLNQADNIYLGGTAVNAVYYGTTKVWPPSVSVSGTLTAIEAKDIASITAIACDPYFANTILLMGYEGADASTGAPGMTDESQAAQGIAFVQGGAQIDTAQFKFGTSSGLFNGTDASCSYIDQPSMHLGSGAFTVECWIRPAVTTGGNRFIVGQWSVTGQLGWEFYQFNDTLAWNVSTDGTNSFNDMNSPAATLTANTWHAICVDFNGSKYRMYCNGVMVASFSTPRSLFNTPTRLAVGANGSLANFFFSGWIDELRITKGVARYASDSGYTVPTAAFPRVACVATITGTLAVTEAIDIAAVTGTVAAASTIAHRSTSQSSFVFGTGPNAAAAPAGLANNDIMIATMALKASSAVVPSPPAGWTAIDNTSVVGPSGGNTVTHYAWWKRAASESGSYSFTFSGVTTSQICISAYSGCTTSGSPIDVYSKASVTDPTTSGITVTAASVTTTVPNTMLVLASHSFNTSTNTVPSGMTERLDTTFLYRADEARASTGATGTRTYTSGNTSAEPWSAFLIALKP